MELVMHPWAATCAETRERLSAYLEGDLRARERKRVDRHLVRCPRCREVLQSLGRAVERLRSLGHADVEVAAPSGAHSIVDRIRADTS
jgi:predicted anti-sigma-YlaC factor YlaD